MHQLIKLYLSALRSGERSLAAALAREFRLSSPLAVEADRSLQRLPRGPTRWSTAAERTVFRILSDLGERRTIVDGG